MLDSKTAITTFEYSNNYFYTNIGGLISDYLYFYFEDKYKSLQDPIYFFFTGEEPYNNYSLSKNCNYFTLYVDDKNPASDYDYLYKVNIPPYSGYILVKYFVNSSKG